MSERGWLTCLFSTYFVLALAYSVLMPLWEAPDEPAHYHLAWHLARTNRYANLRQNYEAQQPRTYYFLASLVIDGLDKIERDLSQYYVPREIKQNFRVPEPRFVWTSENYRFIAGAYALRWINVVIGGCALLLNWRAICIIAPNEPGLRQSALALAALTPQYLHIMSSVGNDATAALSGALLFLLAVRTVRHASLVFASAAAINAVLLPLTTKLTALPVGIALLLVLAWQRPVRPTNKAAILAAGIVMVVLAGFVALADDVARAAGSEILWRMFSLRENALTFPYLRFIVSQIAWSYWGKVGWLAIGLPAWTIVLLTMLGAAGAGIKLWTLGRSRPLLAEAKLWMVAYLVALLAIAAVLRNGLTTNASQGRFLFPAIGALSIIMVGGWQEALPSGTRRVLPGIVVFVMLLCNAGLIAFGVVPTYYQPFLD